MELSSLPPTRPPAPADPIPVPAAQVDARAGVSGPEILRPVDASEPPADPAPIKGLGIPPLDMAHVGDNDDLPEPPDPPRAPVASLPVMADDPSPETIAAAPDGSEAEAPALPRAAEADLGGLLRDLQDGPANPTVDLRR